MRSFLILAVVLLTSTLLAQEQTANNGGRRAEAIIRLLNSSVSGSPRAYVEAARIVSEDAKKGKVLQQYVMTLISLDPSTPPELRLDDKTMDEYLTASRPKIRALAEKSNNPLAWYLIAMDTGDTNTLKRAADGGNVQAANAWGSMLVSSVDGPVVGPEARETMKVGFNYFKDAAATGDANGFYNMGMCYARGLGVPRNESKAFNCFRNAAEKGHPLAINNLGWFFLKGIVVNRDVEVAARWFAKSADYDNPVGQLNYALALQKGEGVAVDEPKAAQLLKRAADQGNVDAINAYGVCLWKGRGVKTDVEAGIALFRNAASKGYPPAMDNLASCYDLGTGVPKSSEESLNWKMRARAARGDATAVEWLKKRNLKLR